jgi:hypothetical protein
VSGILQFLMRLGVLRKHWIIAAALAITFVCWLSLNIMWPDFPLSYGESVALFLSIFLVIFCTNSMITATKHWWTKRRVTRRNVRGR